MQGLYSTCSLVLALALRHCSRYPPTHPPTNKPTDRLTSLCRDHHPNCTHCVSLANRLQAEGKHSTPVELSPGLLAGLSFLITNCILLIGFGVSLRPRRTLLRNREHVSCLLPRATRYTPHAARTPANFPPCHATNSDFQ